MSVSERADEAVRRALFWPPSTEVTDAPEIASTSGLPQSECPGHLPEVRSGNPEGEEAPEAGEEPEGQAQVVPTLVWWSREGAEQGKPWRVRHSDGSIKLYAVVRIQGVLDFIDVPSDLIGIPDGPKGIGILREGTLLGGNP